MDAIEFHQLPSRPKLDGKYVAKHFNPITTRFDENESVEVIDMSGSPSDQLLEQIVKFRKPVIAEPAPSDWEFRCIEEVLAGVGNGPAVPEVSQIGRNDELSGGSRDIRVVHDDSRQPTNVSNRRPITLAALPDPDALATETSSAAGGRKPAQFAGGSPSPTAASPLSSSSSTESSASSSTSCDTESDRCTPLASKERRSPDASKVHTSSARLRGPANRVRKLASQGPRRLQTARASGSQSSHVDPGTQEWEIERIVGRRRVGRGYSYQVQWKNSWMQIFTVNSSRRKGVQRY